MRPFAYLLMAFLLPAGGTPLLAQQQPAAEASASEAIKPKLGDIMLSLQTRHAKLSLAGEAQNWALADFQIEELKEALEDAEKYYPTFRDIPVKQMIEAIANPAIAEVGKAVATKDQSGFIRAFRKLTAACNSCHQAANRPFIVIQRPPTSAFPNQSFAPLRN